ncbi:hypothetical protein KFK09_025944 [Dendrobium nobile]|uniref:Uncharacterized protein n=1 Tax=Dendrobium nobile TaxID=94219 RepID=A0A8T3A6T0_DENNO|nr:hypothetical protein KFK09_025944 [Dendrobium nobile]
MAGSLAAPSTQQAIRKAVVAEPPIRQPVSRDCREHEGKYDSTSSSDRSLQNSSKMTKNQSSSGRMSLEQPPDVRRLQNLQPQRMTPNLPTSAKSVLGSAIPIAQV